MTARNAYVWNGSDYELIGIVAPPKGDTGDTGPAGPGVVSGGTTDQVLAKNSNADYDTKWVTPVAPVTLSPFLLMGA